ncbi:MAG: hypothetical protein M1817_000822 [Caeruleum heppii]|nr:MAG: hypothetical protein M1817_000822 [Caeruleum heppii]
MSSPTPGPTEEEILDSAEVAEEIPSDQDQPMDSEASDEDGAQSDHMDEEISLVNDSVAHFDEHKDSIFCVAQHPRHPEIVATGGGDDLSYVYDCTPPEAPVLPQSYQSAPAEQARGSLGSIARLDGHTDSVNAVAFTWPSGQYLVTAGLDGRLRAYMDASPSHDGRSWKFLAEAQEVQEINWLISCPHPDHPNVVAFGANDGSVWVYSINAEDVASPLSISQAFYLHTESCTAGSWTPDGKMLATVSEDSSLYVWDIFGEAAAAGITAADGGQSVVGLTSADQRFAVADGLFSVAVAPSGTFVAVGGSAGKINIVGIPRIGEDALATGGTASTPSKKKAGSGRTASAGGSATISGQAGQLLASLQAQSDGVETLSFSQPPASLLAAGSVDGSIVIFDTAHRFAVRRHIREAHEDFAVVKVEFVNGSAARAWVLTSVGMDGEVKRWDTRGGTAAANQGLMREWKGHRGGGEGGGILGFVQGQGDRIVTAGDE